MSKREMTSGLHETVNSGKIDYGCLFCRSGSEERIIRELGLSHPEMNCISPKRVRIRRQGDMELVALFPGYIFFHLGKPVDFRSIVQKADIYKVLKYPTGDWKLAGSDLLLAKWMFEMGGVVSLSKARFEGDTVTVLSGSLKDYEDRINEFNKRAKTAKVTIDFHGMELTLWLGFEIVANDNGE